MAEGPRTLRFFVCTWNVGGSEPLEKADLDKLFHSENEIDVYAVGLQEIKTGAQETVKSFVHYDDWAKALIGYFSKKNYFMIESVRCQGISVSVFSSIKHLPFVRFVKTEIERTGVAGAWGNKGGVSISVQLYGQRLCFLNMHLAAHLQNDEERIKDLEEIYREMEFKGNATVHSHDLVLMFGDTNFRLDDLSREFIVENIEEKNYSVLWEKDQLKRFQKSHKLLTEFQEGPLNFDPTYKYDPGTDTYDTSEKKRKPAWTDRILWRIHPELNTAEQVEDKENSHCTPPIAMSLVDKSYNNHMSFKQSDHKPVTCQFELKILDEGIRDELLRIEPIGEWAHDSDGVFQIELFNGMKWHKKDYIGLYKGEFEGFRSYATYMYVPKIRIKRKPHQDSSSSDDSSDEGAQRSSLDVATDPNNHVKQVTMKKSQINDPGMYRLGYYSHRMLCIAALSEPFQVK